MPVTRHISPHRKRKFAHSLTVERDEWDSGRIVGQVADVDLSGIRCTSPISADPKRYHDLGIENFKQMYTIYALTMPKIFRAGDVAIVDDTRYAIRHIRPFPLLGSKSTELLIEAV